MFSSQFVRIAPAATTTASVPTATATAHAQYANGCTTDRVNRAAHPTGAYAARTSEIWHEWWISVESCGCFELELMLDYENKWNLEEFRA